MPLDEQQILANLNLIITQIRMMAEAVESATKDNPRTEADESNIEFFEGLTLASQGMNVGTYVYGLFRRDQKYMSDYADVLRRVRLTVEP